MWCVRYLRHRSANLAPAPTRQRDKGDKRRCTHLVTGPGELFGDAESGHGPDVALVAPGPPHGGQLGPSGLKNKEIYKTEIKTSTKNYKCKITVKLSVCVKTGMEHRTPNT